MEALKIRLRRGMTSSRLTHVAGFLVVLFACLLITLTFSVSESNGQLLRRPSGQPITTPKSSAPRYVTQSRYFVVNSPDPVLGRKIAEEAERFRKELAIDWLGHEIGEWEDKCPITVELSMHAGGETSFAFVTDQHQNSRPRSWEMKIFGSPERLLDSVLPHEVTHTIFASHFGQPLPRWADEGACTIVEHDSERAKNHQMLIDFLHTNRGIPFNRMFEMKQYPQDILPLYAQGHSLSKFLVMQKGKRHFLDYIAAGMAAEQRGELLKGWSQVTEKYYGFRDLSELQESWMDWVRKGSKEIPATSIAANTRQIEPTKESELSSVILASHDIQRADNESPEIEVASGSWYVRQAQSKKSSSQRQPFERHNSETAPIRSQTMTFQPLEDLTAQVELLQTSDKPRATIWR